MRNRQSVALLCAMLMAQPALPWSGAGHRIIAAIAYDSLSKRARARADELIRRHPDYAKFREGVKGSEARIARWAFVHASTWPDDIRSDPRFFDNTNPNAKPLPAQPGFPDMGRHTNWHFINLYFSPDETPFPKSPVPNVLTELRTMIPAMAGAEGKDPVYLLPWLLHLVGDVHQPLHCISRYTRHLKGRDGKPASDLGGNLANVEGWTNLHSEWDALLGTGQDEEYIDWMAKRIRREYKPARTPVLDPEIWAKDGFEIAKRDAYSFPADVGTREKPFLPSREYRNRAQDIARNRAALAGYRLAAVLNDKLK